jgi:hypothetical protein
MIDMQMHSANQIQPKWRLSSGNIIGGGAE